MRAWPHLSGAGAETLFAALALFYLRKSSDLPDAGTLLLKGKTRHFSQNDTALCIEIVQSLVVAKLHREVRQRAVENGNMLNP
jgi:hypothetical protein